MNKKILIASIFATLMLLVPMTSVVGVSDVSLNRKIEKIEDNNTITETYDNDDCGCQDVSNQHLVNLERLLNRLESYSKIILLLPKFYPDIAEECKELSNRITSLAEMNEELKSDSPFKDVICFALLMAFLAFNGIMFALGDIMLAFGEDSIVWKLLEPVMASVLFTCAVLLALMQEYDCWEDPFPP